MNFLLQSFNYFWRCLSDGQSASFLLERERNEGKENIPDKTKKKKESKSKLDNKENEKNKEKTEIQSERKESKSKAYKKILPPPGVSKLSIKHET